MNWLRGIRHRVAHYFGLNHGRVHTWWKGKELWAAFWCDGCGKMQNEGPTGITADSSIQDLAKFKNSAGEP